MNEKTKRFGIIIGAGCGLALATAGILLAAGARADAPGPYPLKTCVVSGEKLGEMGPPHVFTYRGREIRLCCKGCAKDFEREPAKFMKKIEAAERPATPGAGNDASGRPGHSGCGGCGG